MEKLNLKEVSSKLVNDQKKVDAAIVMVLDGDTSSAIIAGESEKLLSMLVGAMVDKPEFKQLIGKAYLSATIHGLKN